MIHADDCCKRVDKEKHNLVVALKFLQVVYMNITVCSFLYSLFQFPATEMESIVKFVYLENSVVAITVLLQSFN